MNWLRYFLVSTDARPMAYKRHSESRWLLLLAITLICLAVVIGLNLSGVN